MYRCAILNDYQNVAMKIADWSPVLSEVEVTVFDHHIADRARLIEALQDFDIICLMRERTPFDADLINALPKLKLLVTTGGRNAVVDVAACEAKGIVFCGSAQSAGATNELTWALLLALVRNIPAEDRDFKSGAPWQRHISGDLLGKRLGVIGFGRLGKQASRVGVAFGMDVVAYTPNLTDERVAEVPGVKRAASLDGLLRTADYVTIHVGLNKSTRGMIGAREFGLMKPTAFIVNTSRGPIIDEAALIDALRNRRIAGAGLDVYDTEPLPSDHPLRQLDNVIATPHIGFVTESTYRVFHNSTVEDIAAWLKGSPIRVIGSKK